MKKLLALLLCIMLALPALAFTEPSDSSEADAMLMTAADGIIADLTALCRSDGFAEMYSSPESVATIISDTLKHDYSAPACTAVMTLSADSFIALFSALGGITANSADISDAGVQESMRLKMLNVLPGMLNSKQGTEWLAASSIMSMTDVLKFEELEACTAYVISDYGDDRPLTYAAFHVKADGLAMANAGFLKLTNEAKAPLFDDSGRSWSDALPREIANALKDELTYNVYAHVTIVD